MTMSNLAYNFSNQPAQPALFEVDSSADLSKGLESYKAR